MFLSTNVRPIFWKLLMGTIIIGSVVLLTGCGGSQTPTAKQTQSDIAKEVAESISFVENAEIENIKRRLELTSSPSLTGFVLLMNEAGQPIMYTGVTGKITSSGKRLTAPVKEWKIWGKNNAVAAAPSDEGTWGSSSPYVYFWTTTGQYVQWNGKYLYSDKPFRTKVAPLVIAIKK